MAYRIPPHLIHIIYCIEYTTVSPERYEYNIISVKLGCKQNLQKL
jgi:hypothetical protein